MDSIFYNEHEEYVKRFNLLVHDEPHYHFCNLESWRKLSNIFANIIVHVQINDIVALYGKMLDLSFYNKDNEYVKELNLLLLQFWRNLFEIFTDK